MALAAGRFPTSVPRPTGPTAGLLAMSKQLVYHIALCYYIYIYIYISGSERATPPRCPGQRGGSTRRPPRPPEESLLASGCELRFLVVAFVCLIRYRLINLCCVCFVRLRSREKSTTS